MAVEAPTIKCGVELKARLDAVGLWGEFKSYREMLEKTQGMERKKTWRPARDHFLPLIAEREGVKGNEAHNEPAKPGDGQLIPWYCNLETDTFKDASVISNREAIDWAIENVLFKDITAKSAPSSTGWLYLEMFRQDKTFMLEVLKKRVPTITKIDQDKGFLDDGREQFGLIEQLKSESTEPDAEQVRNDDSALPSVGSERLTA